MAVGFNFLEEDFWPGTTSGLPVNPPKTSFFTTPFAVMAISRDH